MRELSGAQAGRWAERFYKLHARFITEALIKRHEIKSLQQVRKLGQYVTDRETLERVLDGEDPLLWRKLPEETKAEVLSRLQRAFGVRGHELDI